MLRPIAGKPHTAPSSISRPVQVGKMEASSRRGVARTLGPLVNSGPTPWRALNRPAIKPSQLRIVSIHRIITPPLTTAESNRWRYQTALVPVT